MVLPWQGKAAAQEQEAHDVENKALAQLMSALADGDSSKIQSAMVQAYESGAKSSELDEFRKSLTDEQRGALKRNTGKASEKLQKDLSTRLKEVDGLKGQVYDSALYYFSEFALENFYTGEKRQKVWIHRNPPPDDDKIFVMSLSDGIFARRAADKNVLGINIWSERLQANQTIQLITDGGKYDINVTPKEQITLQKALAILKELTGKQESVNYKKICQDGKLKSLYAFGHDTRASQDQLIENFKKEDQWQETVLESGDLKNDFLEHSKTADLIDKEAHASAQAAAFVMVDNGKVISYTRVLPKSSGLYKKCRKLKKITEEVIILIPGDESKRTNVSFCELCSSFIGEEKMTKGRYVIYFDTACWSSQIVGNLYCEMVKQLNCKTGGKTDVCAAIFHSPDDQSPLLLEPGLGFQYTMLEGLREGIDFDEVVKRPHDSDGARIVTPGKDAFKRQEGILNLVAHHLGNTGVGVGKIILSPSKEIRSLDVIGYSSVFATVFDENNERVIALQYNGRSNNALTTYDNRDGQVVSSIHGLSRNRHDNPILVSKDLKTAVAPTAGSTTSVEVIDLEKGEIVQHIDAPSGDNKSVAITPDGKKLVMASKTGDLYIYDLLTGKQIGNIDFKTFYPKLYGTQVISLAILDSGKQAVTLDYGNNVRIWDLENRKAVGSFETKIDSPSRVYVTPNEKQIIVTNNLTISTANLEIYDWKRKKIIHKSIKHKGLKKVLFTNDSGRMVTTGFNDLENTRIVNIWDLKTGKMLNEIFDEKDPIISTSSSTLLTDDNRYVIASHQSGEIKMWDISTGARVRSFIGHADGVEEINKSKDGKRLISRGYDNRIKIWDLEERSGDSQEF
ncbi:MAG: hypothetical protein AABZ06_12765 [Bdellovibrionota bacterium]